jgi:hypothetical protein
VIQRIQDDAGVDRDTARTWFNEMLVFLDLVADSKRFISPPGPVDVAWHAFILHTRDYEAYCRDRFGRVIHHQPTGAPDPDAYRLAYERRASAGAVDNTVWVLPAGVVGGAAAAEGVNAQAGGHGVGDAVHDAGPGDGGGGGFFSSLFGGGGSGSGGPDGGPSGGLSGDSGSGPSGDSGGGPGDPGGGSSGAGSSCGGSSCGGGSGCGGGGG